MIYHILSISLLAFLGVGIYGYLKGALAPAYNFQQMTLNYERIGNGTQKIILLHGLTGSLNYWKRGLDDVSGIYSLLLIDLLGFGDSPKPKSKYDIEEHLTAIEKVAIKEGFNSGDVVILGHSLGAILTLGLAAKHPTWFTALVVIGLPIYQDRKAIKNKLNKISIWNGLSVDSRYKFICFFHPLFTTAWFRPKNIPKDVFRDAGKHNWVSYYHTLEEIIINTNIAQIATKIKDKKILFIHGEKDMAAPIDTLEEIIPIFSKARLEKLPMDDHQVFLVKPAEIWSLITGFLIDN